MSKNEGQTPDTQGVDPTSGDAVKVVGQGSGERENDTPTPEPRKSADAPVEGFKLTKLKEDEVPVSGLVELEVVAEGAFQTELGDVLKTGDRRLVSHVDAQAMLDAKVNGKSAFKRL